jgi:hypothetical protein
MTYALTLIKGKSTCREDSLSLLRELSKGDTFAKGNHVTIEQVYVSFGLPDFVVVLKSENVELIKHAIVVIRKALAEKGDDVDTSTIVCATPEELEQKVGKWSEIRAT